MPDTLGMVGRQAEFELLERAIVNGSPQLIQVVGEPGIGKSRLLTEAARMASERGALALTGVAAEFERDLPFGVFVDALDAYLDSLPAARFRGLGDEQQRRLAAVFPALADLAPPLAGVGEERYRSHHAVRALIEQLASRQPCVLCLDDLHWADQASLELVGHLSRRPPAGPVLVVLAFRRPQAPELLIAAMEAAERSALCDRLELSPLSREEAEELLSGALSSTDRQRIYWESGGNPFYLEQLARAAEREQVPRTVRDALAQELAGMRAASRVVIRSAAIAGERFTPEVVSAVAEVDETVTVAALDEGIELGLLRATEAPREFRFRHPIVRAAVYESAGDAWRSGAHARAAAALAKAGAPAATRAEHVARSAHAGDESALAVLAEAGHATAALAPAASARWFEAALELVPADDAGRRLELLAPLARALGSAGRLEDSRRVLAEVMQLLPPELSAIKPRVVGFMALIDRLLGRPGDAQALLESALAEQPDRTSATALSLQVELASDRFFVGEWGAMRDWARRAHALARDLGDPRLLATTTALLALAEYSVDDVAAAFPLLDEAERLVDGDDAVHLDTLDWLSWCELSMERYDQALSHLEQGLRLGRKTGQGHLLMTMRFGLLFAKTWQGKLGEAVEASDATVELARLSGSAQLMSWALTLRCWLMLRAGSIDQALELGEESRRLASSVTPNPFSLVGAGWLAEARVEAGAPAAGRDDLLDVLGGPDLPRIERAFRPYLYDVLVSAELALGRIDPAREWAIRATAAIEGIDLPGRRSFALKANAAVALAAGSAKDAAELALEAAELAGSAHRIEAARCLSLGGNALAAGGDPDGAVTLLRQASAELEECGAIRYRDQAIRDLRRLGQRVGKGGRRGRAVSGLDSLSGRELEVARLVTDRLTNREIAERLVLSQKTVERHLENIFRKLGVASRVEVARAIERSELRNFVQKP